MLIETSYYHILLNKYPTLKDSLNIINTYELTNKKEKTKEKPSSLKPINIYISATDMDKVKINNKRG